MKKMILLAAIVISMGATSAEAAHGGGACSAGACSAGSCGAGGRVVARAGGLLSRLRNAHPVRHLLGR